MHAPVHLQAHARRFTSLFPVERRDLELSAHSGYTLAFKPVSSISREKLGQIAIPITGLDCKACSLAVYEILTRVEGVEQATASFRNGLATAWIDPDKTDRASLEAALKQRRVTLTEQ